jgi:tetratricopeptide (TPR) repeat protein
VASGVRGHSQTVGVKESIVALFKKKPPSGNGSEGSDDGQFEPQPEKARKWFTHARTSAESSNYAYAIQCFANGIRLDPYQLAPHGEMLDAAVKYVSNGGKAATGREVRGLDDGTPIGKFAAAEFEFMKDITNFKPGLKMLDAAAKAEAFEFGRWIAPRVLGLMRSQHQKKKLGKSTLVNAMETFRDVGAWDESLVVGEMARDVDPSDNELAQEIKNLSAQRAMDQGGYDEAGGVEGGFRRFIKDSEKQKELLEDESLAAGASVEERRLARAKAAYDEDPSLPDNINRYAQLLKAQGTEEAEQQAHDIYMKGFNDIGEYRFRMAAGDIRIEQLERERRRLDEQLEDNPDDPERKARLETVRTELLELKMSEYSERVKRYPTDRHRKFDLGQVLAELGRTGEAMEHFQKSKDEPKLRVRAGHMLGRCFMADGWYTEAISEFEDALRAIEATERDRELAIKYDLMLALLAAAQEEDSIDMARQSKSICSEIARSDITYRDIRAKRKEVDEVIRRLSGEES